jgi:hypothetical protein
MTPNRAGCSCEEQDKADTKHEYANLVEFFAPQRTVRENDNLKYPYTRLQVIWGCPFGDMLVGVWYTTFPTAVRTKEESWST